MSDQRLDRTEVLSQGAEADGIHQFHGGLGAGCDLEGEHASMRQVLPFRQSLLRKRGESGIMHPLNRRMRFKPLRDDASVFGMQLEPHWQSLDAALRQPGILRRLNAPRGFAN